MENEIIQFLDSFRINHSFWFWLIAILGFPEAELIALLAIAIATIN